ncbi:hypothetical protein DQ384_36655 [Sphaerisporangium album]|uniref:Uncharacterized protein n=1 Tax=Sphaerisporangium album TaxID=509200 RepID=A0A367EUR8_9ACTN|nr:hypothetical protein DQ384_36655 [Sphaerisporangium album]
MRGGPRGQHAYLVCGPGLLQPTQQAGDRALVGEAGLPSGIAVQQGGELPARSDISQRVQQLGHGGGITQGCLCDDAASKHAHVLQVPER